MYNSSWKMLSPLTMSGFAGIRVSSKKKKKRKAIRTKATAVYFTANGAQRVNRSVCDLRALSSETKIP